MKKNLRAVPVGEPRAGTIPPSRLAPSVAGAERLTPERVATEGRSGERSDPDRPEQSGGAEVAPTIAADPALGRVRPPIPDPELPQRPLRRQYTGQYKRDILRQIDASTQPGEIGSLLRREGLYSSLISVWRQQRDREELQALSSKKRGPKPAQQNPLAKQIAKLQQDNRQLQRRNQKLEAMLELQKKVSEILQIDLPSLPDEGDE